MKVQLLLSFNLPSDASVRLSEIATAIKGIVVSRTNRHILPYLDISILPDK